MKIIKKTFLFALLIIFPLLTKANSEKKVFALNNLLFINTPKMGLLPSLTYKNYLYSSEKPWMNNNELFYPIVSDLSNQMSLKEAVDYEMQNAMKMGIDGFSFIYMISDHVTFNQRFNDIIEAYFEVAEEKNYPFSFNINIKFEPNRKFDKRIPDAKQILSYFSSNKYSNSKHWHTENGKKVIVFSKVKNLLTKEEFNHLQDRNDNTIKFSILFDRINSINADSDNQYNIIYTCIWPSRSHELQEAGKHYDYIRIESLHMNNTSLINKFSKRAKQNNMKPVHTIYHEQVSSYFVEKSTNIKRPKGYVSKNNLPIDQVYKEYDNLSLSKGLRLGFDQASDHDMPFIFLNSWNMFVEGNHFRPDYHHGYGLSELTRVLIQNWKGDEMDEVLFAVYQKKSVDNDNMLEYKIRKKYGDTSYSRDSIEIITSATKKSTLYLDNNVLKEVEPGLQITTIPFKEGDLNISLKRGNASIGTISSPNAISTAAKRNEPTVVYRSSLDNKNLNEMYNLLAQYELKFYDIRFILTPEIKSEWVDLEKERMKLFVETLQANEDDQINFENINKKNYQKYEKKIKKLLPPDYFQVWKELQDEKLKYQNTVMKNFDIYDLSNTYNILELE